jgi:hypothetical protein
MYVTSEGAIEKDGKFIIAGVMLYEVTNSGPFDANLVPKTPYVSEWVKRTGTN